MNIIEAGRQAAFTPVVEKTIFTDTGLQQIVCPTHKAIVVEGTNRPIAVVSKNYKLVPHGHLITEVEKNLAEQGVNFSPKYVLPKAGARLFATYVFNDIKADIQSGDGINLQLILKNSYDGSSCVSFDIGAYRMACSNGLVVGKTFAVIKKRHTKNMELPEIIIEMQRLIVGFDDQVGTFRRMAEVTVGPAEAQDIITQIIETDKQFPKSYDAAVRVALGNEEKFADTTGKPLSMWSLYNAFTYPTSHQMEKKSPERAYSLSQRMFKWFKDRIH